jgi:hypothetical protein
MARQPIPSQQEPAAQQRQATKFMVMLGWKKMNTAVARQNLAPDELAWAENVQPIAPNYWHTVPAPNAALTTVMGRTVARQFPANIGATDYIIFFSTDGSCTAVNANTGAQTSVAAASTFSTTPDMTVFASSRILIMDPTAGYATWDGTLFVGSGGISPNIHVTAGGSGYTSAPAISFTGGAGGNAGGATATATVSGGAVVTITLTNPGTGNAAGAAITVVIGGPGTGATATVVVWPQVKGNTIDVFAGRVWWASQNAAGAYRILNFTGTAGYDDTNPANAAGSSTITDSDLAHNITGIRNRNNFLYIFGDESIKQIGSITVSGSVTLFNILTVASDVGTSFLMTIQSYNRIVVFANKNGVWGIFGATVSKISDDLDGIFQLVDWTQALSSSLQDLHATVTAGGSIHCYLLLLKYVDPVQGSRSIIVAYQKDKWFVINQGNGIISICPMPLASTTQWETFASSGSDVTQLLQQPNTAVTVLIRTALSGDRNFLIAKSVVRAGAAFTAGAPLSVLYTLDTENTSNPYTLQIASQVTWINNAGLPVQWQNNTPANVYFIGSGFRVPRADMEGYGKLVGASISGSLYNLSLNAVAIEYAEEDLWGDTP